VIYSAIFACPGWAGPVFRFDRHIRPALSDCVAITLATSLVQSRLDCANCLLHGTLAASIHKLQCTQNSLSRVILSGRHRDHLLASKWLSNLHWLPGSSLKTGLARPGRDT